MKFLTRWFGKPATPAREAMTVLDSSQSQFPASQSRPSKPQAPGTANATRKEMLRVVLRDTMKRHGIPAEWITGETLSAMSRTREPGLYWRLTMKHWDARLPNHFVALQNALVSRVQMFDPLAEKWLLGIMWQLAPADESACPALPHPGSWTAVPREAAPAALPETQAAGDVIAGPVSIDPTPADVKADLARLMSALDAQFQAQGEQRPAYAATEPARL
jgi:hypothetical protein